MSQRKKALVDDDDYAELAKYTWTPMRNHRTWYAYRWTSRRTPGGRSIVLMHRQIMRPDNGREVDHEDSDGLNNQRHNLRCISHQANIHRQRKTKRETSSRFKGVHRKKNRWIAQIMYQGKRRYLGSFKEEIDAAKAYDAAAQPLFGTFARLNFSRT